MGQITATRNLVATKVVRLAGQIPGLPSQIDINQQIFDIYENIQTSSCLTRYQVRYHCLKHNVVLFSTDAVTLHGLLSLDLPSLRILHVIPPQQSIIKAPMIFTNVLLSVFVKFIGRVPYLHSCRNSLCERFQKDMVAFESISKPLRHRSYRTLCTDVDELQEISFKMELLNFLDLYLPENSKFVIHNSHAFNSIWEDYLGRRLSDECLLRWKRQCDTYRS